MKAISSDLIPQGNCDMILSVEPMEALRYLHFLAPEWLAGYQQQAISKY